MTDDLKRISMEEVGASSKYYSSICIKGLKETVENLSGKPTQLKLR
jgi:hypothetical protein